jgi:hypothetical protein
MSGFETHQNLPRSTDGVLPRLTSDGRACLAAAIVAMLLSSGVAVLLLKEQNTRFVYVSGLLAVGLSLAAIYMPFLFERLPRLAPLVCVVAGAAVAVLGVGGLASGGGVASSTAFLIACVALLAAAAVLIGRGYKALAHAGV